MRDNFREASNDCGYFYRYADSTVSGNLGNNLNSLYANTLDRAFPIEPSKNSDLKEIYLSREQLYNLDN